MCGMSVVRDFEKFKRYNLSEVSKTAKGNNASEGAAEAERDEKSEGVAE